jgi:hypothetical protein
MGSLAFEPPLTAGELAAFERSGDPWAGLAVLVHRAAQGDFADLRRVGELLHAEDGALFWSCATCFAGQAGPWPAVEAIAESFRAERHNRGVQEYISSMLAMSGNPAFGERLLELYEAAVDGEMREHIALQLGCLLGAGLERGAAETDKYTGADAEDVDDYAALPPDEILCKVRDLAGYRAAVRAAQAAAPAPAPRCFQGHIVPR